MKTPTAWRKSTHSSGTGSCVEMRRDEHGHILVRNSNHPDAGTLAFTPAEVDAWLAGVASGEFNDLV